MKNNITTQHYEICLFKHQLKNKFSFLLILISVFSLHANSNYKTNFKFNEIFESLVLDEFTEALFLNTQFLIEGIVTDENGIPLPGANVLVKGTGKGVVTDFDGKYTIEADNSDLTLVVSYLGYKTKEISINGQSVINITLETDTESLDEIVLVGFGRQKKQTVTGAISAIETKELLRSPQANVTNALTGRLPGVTSVQRSGLPGEDAAQIRIRGISTFTGSGSPLIMVDGIETNTFGNLDPNEIESITVLKDASATAVYGVRGANGVILITTKRGEIGEGQLTLTTNFGINEFHNLRDNMNSFEYAMSYNEGARYDAYSTGSFVERFSPEDIERYRTGEDPIFYPNTDWKDYTLESFANQYQANINYSGGTEKVKYFVSAGYLNQESLFTNFTLNDDFDPKVLFERYNLRSNFDFQITNRLKTQINVSTQMENRRNINLDNAQFTMLQIYRTAPNASAGIVDGRILQNGAVLTGELPVEVLVSNGESSIFNTQVNGMFRADYDLDFITKGLSTYGIVSYQQFSSAFDEYFRSEPKYQPKRFDGGTIVYVPLSPETSNFTVTNNVTKNRRVYNEFGINYKRTFGDHAVSGLAMYNRSKLFDNSLQFRIPNAYLGFVGRLTYNYQEKYLTEFNVGYNGTENFAEGQRFGFFPAVSLGWVVSKESFFPKNNIITNFKIRGSYGEVGNDKIGGDRFLYLPSSYQFGTEERIPWAAGYNFGEIGSSYNLYGVSQEGQLGNPNVTWERAKKMNIGTELSFFNGMVNIVADYFEENRDNILAAPGTVRASFGIDEDNLALFNLGEMENKGFDGEISFNHAIGDFSYWLKANYTFARNKVLFRDEVNRTFPYQQETGQRVGQFFGLKAEGFYNTWEEINDANRPISVWNGNLLQPGDVKYKDINGDGKIDLDDQIPIGYSQFPEANYGISFGGSYKGFELAVLFQGARNASMMLPGHMRGSFNQDQGVPSYILGNSWTQELYEQGANIDFPRLSASGSLDHNYIPSTLWLYNSNYIRLKNVEVGYNFNKTVNKALGVNNIRIYLSGNNLITWDDLLPGLDPENPSFVFNGEPYPATRLYNLGLNINF